MLAEGEILREAKRILPRLSVEGAYVALLDDKEYGVFVPKNKWRKPILPIAKEVVDALCRRELLGPASQSQVAYTENQLGQERQAASRYCLTSLGEKFLRRLKSLEQPFQEQHRVKVQSHIRTPQSANTSFTVNLCETPLGWLLKRKRADGFPLITEFEYEAGERLREDFTQAQLSPRITSDWSMGPRSSKTRLGPSEGLTLHESVLAAKKRVSLALEAVGPSLSDVLLETCCFLNGLEEAERTLGWPRRSGKVVLEIALARLAEHYRLVPSHCAHPRYCKEKRGDGF